MSALLSTSKSDALLARVQANPEIGTDNAAYVADLIQRAAEDYVTSARLPRYPELSRGYSKSNTGAGTDITGLASAELAISANGSEFEYIEIALTDNDTGAEIATALETAIQAGASDSFDEITVVYDGDDGAYTITSGRYGESSNVYIAFDETGKHVAQSLKLSPDYGGTEVVGASANEEADDYVVEVAEILYRKLGLEGVQSGTVPGDISFTMFKDELSPRARRAVTNVRRVFS